jgi:hypothetical protein
MMEHFILFFALEPIKSIKMSEKIESNHSFLETTKNGCGSKPQALMNIFQSPGNLDQN